MKYKRNFYQGYKGYKGTKLDQTECELYDDIPTEDHQELMLRILAGGQVAEERRRAMFYDGDTTEDENDENDGNDQESFDYIQAYNKYRQRKIELFKRKQEIEIEKQNLKNEMNELKKQKQEIDMMKQAETPPNKDK